MVKAAREFHTDTYRQNRGGYSRLLRVNCRECGSFVALYQKDGPGELRRMYLDRIFEPKSFVALEQKPLSKISPLQCRNCGDILGTPCLFTKEKRKAFRLYQDAVVKHVQKLNV